MMDDVASECTCTGWSFFLKPEETTKLIQRSWFRCQSLSIICHLRKGGWVGERSVVTLTCTSMSDHMVHWHLPSMQRAQRPPASSCQKPALCLRRRFMLDIDKPPQKYDSIALPGPYLTPELALFRHYLTLSNDSIQYVFARYSEGSVGCFSKRASSHRFQGRPLLTIGHKEFLGRKTVSKECSSNHVYGLSFGRSWMLYRSVVLWVSPCWMRGDTEEWLVPWLCAFRQTESRWTSINRSRPRRKYIPVSVLFLFLWAL